MGGGSSARVSSRGTRSAPPRAPPRSDQLDLRGAGEDAGLDGALVEAGEGLKARAAHVEGEVVHVHAHEGAPLLEIESAPELERVIERLALVIERGLDAGAEA